MARWFWMRVSIPNKQQVPGKALPVPRTKSGDIRLGAAVLKTRALPTDSHANFLVF
jgi:hypothetical protein